MRQYSARLFRPTNNAQTEKMRKDAWYTFSPANSSSDRDELYIYEEISDWWGITAGDFIKDLRALRAPNLDLYLNSPGGSVFDGLTIYNAIRRHHAHVLGHVDGLAASIASVIAMACDELEMAKTATMMIHDGMCGTYGNEADHLESASLLATQSDIIAQVYADRAGGSRDAWRAKMRNETWYNATEALNDGLITRVVEVDTIPDNSLNKWDLTPFNFAGRALAPAPVNIATPRTVNTVPDDSTPSPGEDSAAAEQDDTTVGGETDATTDPEVEAAPSEDEVSLPQDLGAFLRSGVEALRVAREQEAAAQEPKTVWDPEVFRAAMRQHSKAASQPSVQPVATKEKTFSFDSAALRAAIREAVQ
jgi:ATP-dependent protease ClpP protease subunit